MTRRPTGCSGVPVLLSRAGVTWAVVAASLCHVMPAAAQYLAGREPVDDIVYHFMPIAWRDSNNDAQRLGDFGGMTASLDYLEYLGVTAVWMNPIFPSPAYHGYQHGPMDQVNPWFGSEAEFLNFVAQAHARGIKVYLDVVAYGISHNSVYFQSAFGNPASPYDTWLAFTNSANTEYQGYTFTTWNNANVGFVHWDLRTAAARNLVIDWSKRWLDPDNDGDPSDGIDGYRLDHVWAQYGSGPDGWGYNIDDFWTPWKAALQSVKPGVFTFAEQANWASTGADLLSAHDASLAKPLLFAARSALNSENAAGLYNEMQATLAALPDGRLFMGSLGDHDVDRLTSSIGGSLAKGRVAAAILMTTPLPPMIYFGDEIGMLGQKLPCGGDATDIGLREPFKWTRIAGPPMTNYSAVNFCAVFNRYSQDNDGRSVEEQQGVPGSLLEEYRTLIAARKNNVALRRGTYYPVPNNKSSVWTFVRHDPNQQVLVAINLAAATQAATLNLTDFEIPGGSTQPTNLLTGGLFLPITNANKGAYEVFLPGNSYRLFRLSINPPAPPPMPIDGLDIPADLGAANLVATQDNATSMGDNLSELNQLFVRTQDAAVRLGLTGNLQGNGAGLALFFDVADGGQNILDLSNESPPPAAPLLTGLRFDAGFAPDTLLFVNNFQGTFYVDQYALLAGGGVQKVYRGAGTVGDGDAFLSGGTNLNGMQIAFDNANTAGVTDTSAAGAATATSGFEMEIPLVDLGLPADFSGTVGFVSFLMRGGGEVSNQWLPGLGASYPALGFSPQMDTVPGVQFARLDLARRGDANCDAVIDFSDIDAFVLGLGDPAAYAASFAGCPLAARDVNGDGEHDFSDIDPFVAALLESAP